VIVLLFVFLLRCIICMIFSTYRAKNRPKIIPEPIYRENQSISISYFPRQIEEQGSILLKIACQRELYEQQKINDVIREPPVTSRDRVIIFNIYNRKHLLPPRKYVRGLWNSSYDRPIWPISIRPLAFLCSR
jgi:hypothetical protein